MAVVRGTVRDCRELGIIFNLGAVSHLAVDPGGAEGEVERVEVFFGWVGRAAGWEWRGWRGR